MVQAVAIPEAVSESWLRRDATGSPDRDGRGVQCRRRVGPEADAASTISLSLLYTARLAGTDYHTRSLNWTAIAPSSRFLIVGTRNIFAPTRPRSIANMGSAAGNQASLR